MLAPSFCLPSNDYRPIQITGDSAFLSRRSGVYDLAVKIAYLKTSLLLLPRLLPELCRIRYVPAVMVDFIMVSCSHLYQVLNPSIQRCFRLNCKKKIIYNSMHLYITGNDCVINDGLSDLCYKMTLPEHWYANSVIMCSDH